MRSKLLSLSALALVAATGCSAVRMSRVRPDYAEVDQQATKRLVVVTAPAPGGDETLGELWAVIARRYANQNRNYLAKDSRVAGADFQPTSACEEGVEGVMLLQPRKLERKGAGVEGDVLAQLFRCTDGEEVWAAEAAGSWDSENALYRAQQAQYVAELGEGVAPYVAPSFQLLMATLNTLPNPVLTDEDVEEKIELGE